MAIENRETGTERRRFCRRNISEFQLLTADVSFVGSRRQCCVVLNVSQCGLALQPFLRIPAGNTVDLTLGVPGTGRSFQGKGLVVWTAAGGPVGIELVNPVPEMREGLRRWVSDDLCLTPAAMDFDAEADGAADGEFGKALRLIARRAQVATHAHGVAIALGDAESMICRASSGLAPDLGIAVLPGRGLAGQCLSTGRLALSADARSDSRIEKSTAHQLQLGSAVVLPVYTAGNLSGLLCAFSRHLRAFDQFHVARLERFAAVVSSVLQMSLPDLTAPRSEAAAPASLIATPKLLTAEAASEGDPRSLHRLESLWSMIEAAHHRRKTPHSSK